MNRKILNELHLLFRKIDRSSISATGQLEPLFLQVGQWHYNYIGIAGVLRTLLRLGIICTRHYTDIHMYTRRHAIKCNPRYYTLPSVITLTHSLFLSHTHMYKHIY